MQRGSKGAPGGTPSRPAGGLRGHPGLAQKGLKPEQEQGGTKQGRVGDGRGGQSQILEAERNRMQNEPNQLQQHPQAWEAQGGAWERQMLSLDLPFPTLHQENCVLGKGPETVLEP